MCGLEGGPPQDSAVWRWLDLGDCTPYEQGDILGTAPRNSTEKFRLGETRGSQGSKPAGQTASKRSQVGASEMQFS